MKNTFDFKFCLLLMFLSCIPISHALSQEGIIIRGKVTDEALKEAIPGANVTIKGIKTGAITDFDGNYSITVPVSYTHLTLPTILRV